MIFLPVFLRTEARTQEQVLFDVQRACAKPWQAEAIFLLFLLAFLLVFLALVAFFFDLLSAAAGLAAGFVER